MPELWDVYTVDRVPTGESTARADGIAEGNFHVVVHLCIFDSAGRMLIQRRDATKPTWPGQWDFSVGGSSQAGETSRQAIARETLEELGLEVDFEPLRPAFTFNFPGGFDDFYLIQQDVDLERLAIPNREVSEATWASKDEVLAMAASGEFIGYRQSVLAFVFDFLGQRDIFEDSPFNKRK